MSDLQALSAIRTALDGLADRQRVTTDNVANIQTPGFQARTVAFEDALRSALEGGQAPTSSDVVSQATSSDPFMTDTDGKVTGSNVNLERETLVGLETNMKYTLMTRAYDNKISMVKDVLRTA